VLDVGAWFQEHRHQQSVADSAALAGAQSLPESTSAAGTLANAYAGRNGGTLSNIAFSATTRTNDTISVTADSTAPAFLSTIFGINTVNVTAKASATAGVPVAVNNVSPITVDDNNPQLICGPSCFGSTVQLSFNHNGNYPGIWTEAGVSNLQGSGNPSNSTVAGWMTGGYPGSVSLNTYPGFAPSVFNSSQVQTALQGLIGQTIIVMVHSGGGPTGTGPYTEIGWAAFVIQTAGVKPDGISGYMTGYFTTATVRGTPSTNPGDPYFGVKTIYLSK
jgi:hypothetical protein